MERKRKPWLTCALLVTCAGFQVAANRSERAAWNAVEQGLAGAEELFARHPYLEPHPLLADWLGGPVIERWRVAYEVERERRGGLPVPDFLRESQQERLDEKVWHALAPLDARLSRRLALDPRRPATLASHPLVHAHWLHLGGNLLLLLVIGGSLESALGRGRLTAVGLAAWAASAAACALLTPAAGARWIGSSGLASGLLGAFAARRVGAFRRADAAVLLGGGLWLAAPPILGLAWAVVPGSGSAVVRGAAIAWVGSLLAALAAGLAAGFLLRALERARSGAEGSLHPLFERALEARRDGRLERAHAMLARVLRESPEHPQAGVEAWEVACLLGRPGQGAPALLDVIRSALARGEPARAGELWLQLEGSGVACEVEPALALRLAPALAETDRHEAAADLLRRVLHGSRVEGSAVVAARVARAAREIEPELAQEAAWQALGSLELGLEQRQSLEVLLGELWRAGSGLEEAPSAFELPATVPPFALPAPSPEIWEAPAHPGAEPAPEPEPPAEAADALPPRPVHAIAAVPLDLDDDALAVEIPGLGKKLLPLAKLEALASASVAEESTVLVDLVLNWSAGAGVPLQVLRLRAGQFDPRLLAPDGDTPAQALRAFISALLERSGAVPLPDARSARGRPYASFASLDDYTRDVLLADASGSELASFSPA